MKKLAFSLNIIYESLEEISVVRKVGVLSLVILLFNLFYFYRFSLSFY
jgi:hypothetical protein